MCIGFAVQIGLLIVYGVSILWSLPGFVRLIRGKSRIFDGIHTCCGLLAMTFMYNILVIIDQDLLLFPDNDEYRILSKVAICIAYLMLVTVLFKFEKAIRNAGDHKP